ncbi:DinB family protein [Streptomyces sp. NPDC049879]|uniref:DinB family protein n=1 Tax=Streptomyces sp. NPDC049879 TaxID=3365598 RepID=UPI0037B91AB6
MTAPSPRLAPLLAQLDTSLDMLLARMRGLGDAEYRWLPEPDAATVAPDAAGRLRPAPLPDDAPRTRTIAVLAGHLGEMAVLRADHTVGSHAMGPDDVSYPATAGAGLAFVRDGWARWRAALAGLADGELDVVGRCGYPGGLDPTLPILDIVWWMNRELIHHGAEMAFVRDLYARRSATA